MPMCTQSVYSCRLNAIIPLLILWDVVTSCIRLGQINRSPTTSIWKGLDQPSCCSTSYTGAYQSDRGSKRDSQSPVAALTRQCTPTVSWLPLPKIVNVLQVTIRKGLKKPLWFVEVIGLHVIAYISGARVCIIEKRGRRLSDTTKNVFQRWTRVSRDLSIPAEKQKYFR